MVVHESYAAKSPLQEIEHLSALGILADMQFRDELYAKSRTRILLDGDVETSFSVYEACQVGIESFLLIVRTDQIFTAHIGSPYEEGVTGMDEYCRILGVPSI